MKSITLISDNGQKINLKLHKERWLYTVEEILSVSQKVFEDRVYDIEIEGLEKPDETEIFINGEKTEYILRNGVFFLKPIRENVGTFYGQFGFAQISIHTQSETSPDQWFYSELVSIMVPSSKNNREINEMLKYVYENQDDVLKKKTSTVQSGQNLENQYDDFWSQIIMLENIASVYESCYGFFMTNSRQKLQRVEVVDRVERLQYIDGKTIHYIVQHPEYLRNEASGIRLGKGYYLPSKTLMLQNQMTRNIYENQVVVSFLERIYLDAVQLKNRIDDYLQQLEFEQQDDNGYIESAFLLYFNATEILKTFKERVEIVTEKLKNLYTGYSTFLDVERVDSSILPAPTPVFLSVPQYNMVYTCLVKWFSKTGYEFNRELLMMNFMDIPSIYEAYVLIKLVNQIKRLGFSMTQAKRVVYPMRREWMHRQKDYCNTYVFEKEDQSITLYYEPVIYDEPMEDINDIALYRNNTVALNPDTDEERRGHYYVPDYLLKVNIDGKDRYLVCDAKYTYLKNIRTRYVPSLSYKYLFSISPARDDVTIVGMGLFYGIIDDNIKTESFYDKQQGKITPFVEMMPLSESLEEGRQESNIVTVLQEMMKKQDL